MTRRAGASGLAVECEGSEEADARARASSERQSSKRAHRSRSSTRRLLLRPLYDVLKPNESGLIAMWTRN
jgi:hypothetical protein